MKHIRFYEEFSDGRKRNSLGTVIAVVPENRCPDGSLEAVGAVFERPDSPVASTAVARNYLSKNCKRELVSVSRRRLATHSLSLEGRLI